MLTDVLIRALVPRGRAYAKSDGRGLYLLVLPSGTKVWRFIYQRHGRQRWLTLGTYGPKDVTLADARVKLDAARRVLASGKDPALHREDATPPAPRTFAAVLKLWLDKRKGTVEPLTYERDAWVLKSKALPMIGKILVSELTSRQVLDLAEGIQGQGRKYTALRVKQLIGQVLRFAIGQGFIDTDVTAALKGALMPAKVRHFPAITDPEQLGKLLTAIDGIQSDVIRAALQLAPLVFVRPGELRLAEWSEVDLPGKLWRIPASRMKMREAHLVPLSTQAVAILETLKPISGGGRYLFPSIKSHRLPISENTLAKALHRLGFKRVHSLHGFRATARTLLAEALHVDPYVIEIQLAHVAPGPLGAAYNRARYLAARKTMMQAWADHLETLRAQ